MDLPATHYAKSGDVYVAYQIFGDGPLDLVFVPGWISHLDIWWDSPITANWLTRFGRFARVIMFDKRGTGLSDRGVALPGMEERMDDIRAVMDAAGSERAAVLGISEGGSLATLFAATHPDRCQALVLHGAYAQFPFLFPTQNDLEAFFAYVRTKWGSGENMAVFSPSLKDDDAYRKWWARRERSAASPSTAIAIMQLASEVDISSVLPAVRVPTLVIHRSDDSVVDLHGGQELARLIPDAQLIETPGKDHMPWCGNDVDTIADKIEEFLTGSKPPALIDRVLATVLFTDIVGSSAKAESLGDSGWKALRTAHDQIVREELARYRGKEVKNLGDGYLATFDGPARAACCALSIIESVRSLGIEIRAGVHTGEVEMQESDVGGIAVHIAARVAEHAGASECLVSRTVKDLVAGAGLSFRGRGKQKMKGLAEPVDLFAVSM
ncbi:adenylate/guanylate cyclase domain-containing protein [Limibacillus halophilus]